MNATCTHIDGWTNDKVCFGNDDEKYAAFFFFLKRLPAAEQIAFAQFTDQFKLFCTYKKKTYRVTGASRLGDVWLTDDFTQDHGYQLRVNIDDCTGWRK